MSSKFPKTPSDENLQSLAHDLLGVDLNSPADLDEPFDVDGLGLDDLGFGGPTESAPPARIEEPVPTAAAVVESDTTEDPLAWIVKASRNPPKPAETRQRVATPIEIDDWDDDDFGAGILEVPAAPAPEAVAPPAAKSAPAKKTFEPEDDFGADDDFGSDDDFGADIDTVEDESFAPSAAVNDEDEPLGFGSEESDIEETAAPRRGRQQVTRDSAYWDALEGWNEWEEKSAPAARSEESRDSSDRRGRRSRGDRRPRRDNDSASGGRRSERPAQERAEKPAQQRSEPREAREETPANNERRSRRERPAPQPVAQEDRPRREPARQAEEATGDEPRRGEGRRRSGGRSRGRDRNRDAEVETRNVEHVVDVADQQPAPAPQRQGRDRAEGDTPNGEEGSGRSRRRGSRNRGRGGRDRDRERPIEEPVQLTQESDDDFGGGVFAEPVQDRRPRRRPAPQPAPVVNKEFGEEDDFVEEAPVVIDGDDFGAGLELEAPRTRRRPPPSGRRQPNTGEERPNQGSRRGPRQERPRPEAQAEQPRRSEVDELPAVDPDKYAGVPTWEHAISLLVKKQPRSSGPRRSGGGGGGGRGGDNGRRRGNGRGNRNGGGAR